jgi:hypothetical protein
MDTGEQGDGMRDAPMAMAMKMVMEMGKAVTPIAMDTASTVHLNPRRESRTGSRGRGAKP